jgi:hypothetical protein
VARELDAEKIQIRERAAAAVRRYVKLRNQPRASEESYREAKREALSCLGSVRPSKTMTVDGVRYKAVTSRSQLLILSPRRNP